MIAMGFVKTWQQLAALRVILGIFEAGFFPGCVYLLSTWYCRYEMGRRNAFFYLIGMLASAFSGILAFGLMQMDGLGGYQGWSWIVSCSSDMLCLHSTDSCRTVHHRRNHHRHHRHCRIHLPRALPGRQPREMLGLPERARSRVCHRQSQR